MTTVPNSPVSHAPDFPATSETAHSDLIARLVAEAFAGPAAGRRPEAPAHPGLPLEIPGVSSTEAAAVPPVHPSDQPAAPKL